MADNKGEEDMESTSKLNSEPRGEDSGDPELKDVNSVIVIEPDSKEGDDLHSQENVSQMPTPANVGGGGDASSNSAGAGGAGSTSSSPVGNTNGGTTESSGAGDIAATSPTFTTEMSPPPTVPPANPVTPINLMDTCAVCKQSLQTRDCEPKLLPCLHSFCLKCIPQPERQVTVQVPGPNGQPDTHIVNVMRCIVCCQDCKQSDIIDNYFVKDTTEASNTSDEKSAQMCTSCEDNADTIGFCAECGEWLCKTCIEAHQRVKITKDHKIRKKEDVSEESVGASGQRPVFCPVHKQEPLKLFCETCDTLTCRDCQLLEHKEHRYQFLEEAFQNQKGFIETHMAKLQEKKTYVHYSHAHVTSRLKEVTETHRKVEHEIKIAVFTLINEINKKGKCLLQQLESVTKERSMKLFSQQTDIANLARQILHVLNFTHSAINSGSSTALLYSKRLIIYQLRKVLKAGLEPVPQANGSVRFFCDPTFWAKNVVNLGNLVIEKMPQAQHPPNIMVGPISPGHGHPGHGKHPGQINLAQLRLQHMQQQAFAQQKQQQQHQQPHQQQQQHQQRIQEQMRIASQMSQQHPRQGGPPMVQQQPPRLISMQAQQRGPMNGGPLMYPPHHLRLAPGQGRMPSPSAQPRMPNGQQYPPMMQPQLQRQLTIDSEMSHHRFRLLHLTGHSNPGHAGPFPVASLHNVSAANPTSPTSASMASAHAHRGPASPIVGAIELIPSVTNPENLPCLPDIPPIQLEDAGSSSLDALLSRWISASTYPQLGLWPPVDMNPSPGLSTHSPGSSGLSNSHTPVRPSSTSSTGSRGSCGSAGRPVPASAPMEQQVKVKQEPGIEKECGFSGTTTSNVKTERGKDGGRSACMMSSPEISRTPPLPVLGSVASASSVQDALKKLGEHVKTEPQDQEACSGANGPSKAPSISPSTKPSDAPLTNSKGAGPATLRTPRTAMGTNQSGAGGKDDDPNEDWCAVCNNGGELLCCDRCPKVFHITCHIPTLKCSPSGEWMCTFCRSLASPELEYEPDDEPRSEKDTSEKGLSPEDQRRCERLLLNVFCHELSEGFQEPVPPSIPNYYKIIKKPMDLTLVKQKLQLKHVQHYQSPIEFVSDVRLVFSNCAKYNEMSRIIQVYDEEKQSNVQADSEVAQAGKAVSLYFEERLLELYPDESFPEVPEEPEAPVGEEADLTEDSEDEFVQPKRKRLKTDENMLHIK
ncbi:E3 ubiquitin-protein ligase TRIM33-like isoform X2 [Salvelinus fontinalis]|uniref:E3 ubiquitin-protein ligase TRIM33-like isoform X2 n=1 Tax=Salvelinus fontinalis TaxID=8038 RepID=UPI002486355B|nr:E3 ubiquitin-protein ligase TRIM33-like isoform X2 [Salvelinus fontinalis]